MGLIFKISNELQDIIIQIDHTVMDYSWSQDQWSEVFQEINSLQCKSRYRLFIATEARAFALFEHSSGEWSYLLKIATHPRHMKRSLAIDLLRLSLGHFRQDGCKTMSLEVGTENTPALKLYEKVGFVKEREVRGFYSDGKSAYKMITALC